MNELNKQNRELITSSIDDLNKEIKKIDGKVLKEVKLLQEGNIHPVTLDKISKLKFEREKLLHTLGALYSILGQWKDK